MALSISAVVLLAIIVFLLIKKSGLKAGHAIVCVLLGFYLASSTIAPTISELTNNIAGMIGSINF
ncbi:membrane protein [Streptomyces fumigatiscleroticus]|nr:membrane protein [Streptomyces fumigatiscleroticus]